MCNNCTDIYIASLSDHPRCIRKFLQKGVDVNAPSKDGYTPSWACSSIGIGWSPLHYSVRYGNLKSTLFLISQGANVNRIDSDGYTPLHIGMRGAAHIGYVKVIQALLDAGADILAKDNYGKIPLYETPPGILEYFSLKDI